ncbi:MAG: hypothetical protein K6A05_02425 [Lachnospiraceae bacterium]|nr:hypothetical protein [Lachnospiraceae bacterium]
MNPEDKKKLQNDILLAAEISRQFNIRKPEEAAKVVDFVHARQPFLSPRGAAFQQRIEALSQDENADCTCMLCMQREAEQGIFCQDCLAVIHRSVNRDAEPRAVETSVEEEPDEIAEEHVEELAVDPDMWGEPEPERKRLKLPIWAMVLLAIFIVVVVAVGVLLVSGYRLPMGLSNVESAEEAENVVEQKYSDKEYDIREKESLNAPAGMFDVRVGEYVGDSWDTDLIAVYAYSVVSKEDPTQSAVLWVAEDGRAVGYGTLIDSEDANKIYRVR